MKFFFLALMIVVSARGLYAQSLMKSVPPPLQIRQVSGIIKDTLDLPIIGAVVMLESIKDTLRTNTNEDGIFTFKEVKSATFYLTVSSLGFKTITQHLLKSDIAPRLVLEPILLKKESQMLKEVIISGVPSIVYKTDTVEYKASDYIVRKDATIDELLKKMEGMEVASNGTLSHQGQPVTKAKLNGKDFSGGNVPTAIKSLPAEIVEKIQIVDDYGDEAARTGVKNGEPQKVLNITTKADRSVGNTARVYAGGGSSDRYENRTNLLHLNGNQTLTVNGTIINTVNGVAGGGSSGTGGTTNKGEPSFNYRDNWGKKVEVVTSYTYNYSNVNTINDMVTQQFGSEGTTFLNYDGINENRNRKHTFNAELEYNIDSANYLKITPSISYESTNSINNSTNFQTGLIHQDYISDSNNSNMLPNLSGNIFYQHIFKKRGRNISFNLSGSNSNQNREQEQNTIRAFYDGTPQINEHYLITNNNLSKRYRGSITFIQPIAAKAQLEFNTQLNYRGYDNNKVTNTIDSIGTSITEPSLSNIFNYSFAESRYSVNYRYGTNISKVNFSIGLTAVPAILAGRSMSLSTAIHKTSMNVIPIARVQFVWSRQKRLFLNYSGNPIEPSFEQIQPVRDVSNPQMPVLGNKDLKASFKHSVTAQYNNYIANSKLNISVNINSSVTNNQVSRNYILTLDPVYGKVYETQFVNMNGNHGINGNYNVQKQLLDRKYNIALNGTISYNHSVAMNSNVAYRAISWRFYQRLGPRMNPTTWLEINPNISFDYNTSKYTLTGLDNRSFKNLAFNVETQVDFLKTFRGNFNLSKNYISGVGANKTNNPLIINATLEKKIFKKENGNLRLQVFDLLNQNNFINRSFTETGIVDIRTNSKSRYVMIGFLLKLQKWSGSPTKNETPLKRRGDGSFIQK